MQLRKCCNHPFLFEWPLKQTKCESEGISISISDCLHSSSAPSHQNREALKEQFEQPFLSRGQQTHSSHNEGQEEEGEGHHMGKEQTKENRGREETEGA